MHWMSGGRVPAGLRDDALGVDGTSVGIGGRASSVRPKRIRFPLRILTLSLDKLIDLGQFT